MRFGVEDGKAGVVHTRTGRPFFAEDALEAAVVSRVGAAIGKAGLWEALQTDWVLLDAEVMPWSAKARLLLQTQYNPTVAAAEHSAKALLAALGAREIAGAEALEADAAALLDKARAMRRTIDGYCWAADTLDDYRIAPFHVLACEGQVLSERPHDWHMRTLEDLAEADPVLQATGWRRIDPSDGAQCAAVTEWWEDHTARGGEGLVLKPNAFVLRGAKGLVQPARKVRRRDYLRIIYGPEYDLEPNIARLRKRGLGRKFSLADREFRIGLEGLSRFVERRPLRQGHECALAVLALESEPVDPRL